MSRCLAFARFAILTIITVYMPTHCDAASVLWDVFEYSVWPDNEGFGLWYYGAHNPQMGFQVSGSRITPLVDGLYNDVGDMYAYWVAANRGDVLTEASVLGKTPIADYSYTSDGIIGNDFYVTYGDDFYIALLAGRNDPLYCWIAMNVDDYGTFTVLHSAVSDMPGLVVGQMPEPEPAAGTLAALGLAALLLRRRFGR